MSEMRYDFILYDVNNAILQGWLQRIAVAQESEVWQGEHSITLRIPALSANIYDPAVTYNAELTGLNTLSIKEKMFMI